MIRKLLKSAATFFLILGLSFSNVPFYALTGLIDSYENTSNIVDKIALMERTHGRDVVDNFTTIRNLSEKLRVHEAHAATFVAVSQYNNAAIATAAVTKPAGTIDGDIMFAVVMRNTSAVPTVVPAGWTLLGQHINGVYHQRLYWKLAATEGASYTWTWAAAAKTAITIGTYRGGFDIASPIDVVSNTEFVAAPNTTVRAASMNVTYPNSSLLFFGTIYSTTVRTWTKPSIPTTGWVENYDGGATTSDFSRTLDSMVWAGSGATGNMDAVVVTGGTTVKHAFAVALKPPVTTLSDFVGGEPGNSTIAPGATGLVGSFGLVSNNGTDTVTGATVGLAAGTGARIATVALTNNGDTVTYCSVAPSGDTATLTGCAIPVTTTNTQFKIKITAISHAAMPAPPGGSYPVTATITAFTNGNRQAGTDAGSSTLTIDNASPNGATSVLGTPGDARNTINWTSSNSADFNTTSGSVVYRWTSGSAGAEVPVEGSTPTAGSTNGTATVACVISSAASAAQSKIDGTGGSAGCTTTALTNGQAYTYKVFQKDTSGNYDVGVTIGTFTPVPGISISTYGNSTEGALNYAASCTSCGARIGSGAGFKQVVTITGISLGTVLAGNRSTATNNIKIGAHQIADANVTAWTPTSITFETDSSITGDTDADWGAEFGGATALTVTGNGVTSGALNFYVFPQVISVTQPVGLDADQAREYNAADSDGVITLNGTRFGSSQGAGSVTIVAQTATIDSWTNTAVQARVPTAISDTTNSGNISITQGTGGNSKTHTYLNQINILPRITGFTPANAAEGAAVTINGNHFCQAACPGAFNASYYATFTSNKDATVFTSWSATAIVTAVPLNSVSGDVVIASNSLLSNPLAFTVNSLRPGLPSNLNQWRNSGLTDVISVGGVASSTPIYLTMTVENIGNTGGMLYPQIEYKPIGTAFTCVSPSSYCADAVEGAAAGVAPGPHDCGVVGNACAIAISPTDEVYHWQARARFDSGAGDYYGPWLSYDDINPETSTDFQIDTTAPSITSVSSGSPGTNSATITWSTLGEVSTSQLQYNTSGTFGACAGDCTTLNLSMVNAHSVGISNLNSGTLYYYRVRSKDAAGNESISGNFSFTTSSVSQPAKTTKFHITGQTGLITNGSPLSQSFTISIPENATTTRSIFVEIKGIYSSGASSKDIAVQVNGETVKTYVIPASSVSFVKILHPVTSLDVDPATNTLTVTPEANTNFSILSADIYVNYTYTP